MSAVDRHTTVAMLREQFDQGFAEAAGTGDDALQDYLAVEAGGKRLLLPLIEVAGVAADRAVVAIPAARHGFLGLVAHAGATLPVYALAGLLGYDDAMHRDTRHLVLARGAGVAFAVDAVSGRRRLPSADGRVPDHLHTLWLDESPVTIVRLPALLAGLAARTAPQQKDDR